MSGSERSLLMRRTWRSESRPALGRGRSAVAALETGLSLRRQLQVSVPADRKDAGRHVRRHLRLCRGVRGVGLGVALAHTMGGRLVRRARRSRPAVTGCRGGRRASGGLSGWRPRRGVPGGSELGRRRPVAVGDLCRSVPGRAVGDVGRPARGGSRRDAGRRPARRPRSAWARRGSPARTGWSWSSSPAASFPAKRWPRSSGWCERRDLPEATGARHRRRELVILHGWASRPRRWNLTTLAKERAPVATRLQRRAARNASPSGGATAEAGTRCRRARL